MRSPITVVIVLTLIAVATAFAQAQAPQTQSLEVTVFEVQKGIDFPPDFQAALVDELVKQLTETKKFAQVLKPGATAPDGKAATIRLTGTVIEFQEGSRAKRYLVGFGAGKTKMRAKVQFVDVATGAVKLEKEVTGRRIGGVAGGSSMGAPHGLAKEVAKLAKSSF